MNEEIIVKVFAHFGEPAHKAWAFMADAHRHGTDAHGTEVRVSWLKKVHGLDDVDATLLAVHGYEVVDNKWLEEVKGLLKL